MDEGHGHQQTDGDRNAAPARGWDTVGRAQARDVNGLQAAEQRDRYRLSQDDDGTAAAHRIEDPVRCHAADPNRHISG